MNLLPEKLFLAMPDDAPQGPFIVAVALAVVIHGALLFGLTLSPPVPPVILADQSVEVDLTTLSDPEPELVPEPVPEPEPDQVPEPDPVPEPVPEPLPPPKPKLKPKPPVQPKPQATPKPTSTTATAPAGPTNTPTARRNPKPPYPDMARKRGQEGTVVLLVDVDEKGVPYNVSIEKSSGYDLLDQSALKTVRKWRFNPSRRAGLAVKGQVRAPIRFSLKDA